MESPPEKPLVFVYCTERNRRALLTEDGCQYCEAVNHPLYTGGFFDLPGLESETD